MYLVSPVFLYRALNIVTLRCKSRQSLYMAMDSESYRLGITFPEDRQELQRKETDGYHQLTPVCIGGAMAQTRAAAVRVSSVCCSTLSSVYLDIIE